ncbi:hypothetical protein MUK42_12331 [Musa troglodytarum]|uniref:Uncharacterized protein n=1 Tax=Musa troglodytarum TaxID=320322 RepID=A0A9E7LFX8_9LILI|nr:hypothetical protein MUK42_12331 [Musa troglodytarum]
MPIATGTRGGVGRPGLVHLTAARRSPRGMCGKAQAGDQDSGSSSSIGQDSDNVAGGSSSEGEESRETEVDGGSKGPLDTLEALEESLPMRGGLSGFYSGRSRSFQNLTDAEACSSAAEIGKPENAYTRKRRNQLAFRIMQDESHSSKRRAAAGGSTVATYSITSGGSASYDAAAIEEAGNTSTAATTEEEQDPAQFPPPGQPQEASGNTSAAAAAAAAAATDEEGDPA